MSDTIEMYHAQADMRRRLRAKYGVPCPECVRKLPRAFPSILLPQQRCRIHKYVDPRPELTQEQYDAAAADDEAGAQR